MLFNLGASPPSQSGPLATLASGQARALDRWDINVTGATDSYQRADYSGWTYDSVADRVVFFGGGHGGGRETDAIALPMSTLLWTSISVGFTSGQRIVGNVDARGGWNVSSVLTPQAKHTYNNICVAARKLLALGIMPGDNYEFITDASLLRFAILDFDTGLWSWSNLGSASSLLWTFGSSACGDGLPSGKVILCGDAFGFCSIHSYDHLTDTQATVSPATSLNAQGQFGTKIIYHPPSGLHYVFCGQGNVHTLNYATGVSAKLVTSGDWGTVLNLPYQNYGYDSVNNKFGGNVYGANYTQFDPITRVWSLIPITREAGSLGTLDTRFYLAATNADGIHIFGTDDGQTWAYRP